MKEMHKWKDKVELSLDNRQIFFLFFGASVVGCFVFGMGMMVGRRLDLDVEGQGVSRSRDSLALLEKEAPELDVPLSFQEGLRAPSLDRVPPTRREDEGASAEDSSNAAPAPEAKLPAAVVPEPVEPPKPSKQSSKPAPKPAPKPEREPEAKKAEKKVALASTSATSDDAGASRSDAGRTFTLQMKAFSKQDDADAFAAKLRASGHAARVESHEVKGRVWYRVRVGSFESWADGLAAKEAFEKKEEIIAYVVRQ